MQPRSTDPNEEPAFDWAKAFSGFQRNLFKMFVYGDPLVDETIKKWESEKGTKTKQNQDTKRQQSTNGKQRANNNRQQTAASDSQSAKGNQQSANGKSEKKLMDKIKALETLFDYAHAEVSNPTNANALFESPLIWQAEVLVAVKLLALNLGIDLSKTDIDIQSLEESIEKKQTLYC